MTSNMASKLQYRFLGKSGLKVSNICLGTGTFGENDETTDANSLPESECHMILDRFVECGGNFIDTADTYHNGVTETIIGNWLSKQKDRNRLVIATKVRFNVDPTNPNCCGLSRRHIMWSIEQSLKRLQTDYIDLYQVHAPDPVVRIEETLRALNDLVKCGKVRYVGVCNFCGYQLERTIAVCRQLGLEPVISLEQQYNLVCRFSELGEFKVCEEYGIGILPWSPLKGGLLSGKFRRSTDIEDVKDSRIGIATIGKATIGVSSPNYEKFQNERFYNLIEVIESIANKLSKSVAQVSLRWLLQKPLVTSVIIGVKSVAQLEDNMAAGASDWELSPDEMNELDEASALTDLRYPFEMIEVVNKNRIAGK